MASLEDLAEEYKESVASATHMLIIGPTKSGKSDYIAQAAIDGFDVVYIDNDNGLPTLMERLKNHPEALKRVHYFRPVDFVEFVRIYLKGTKLVYNDRLGKIYASHEAKPDDKLTILWPLRMMKRKSILTTIDSWTTLAYNAMNAAAKAQKIELTSIDKYGREIYGPAGHQMTQMAQLIQLSPLNIVVQAHPSVYEIKEKPPGSTQKETKEGDMIIRDTWEIPQSTSGPHGFSMGKYFNQIGWLDVNRVGLFRLSFKPKYRRIVGGTHSGEEDPRVAYRYSKLFGGGLTLPAPPPEQPWIETMTAAEYQAANKPATQAAPAKPATAPQTQTAATPAPTLQTAPPTKLGGLKFGK